MQNYRETNKRSHGHSMRGDFRALSQRTLEWANRGMPRVEFLREMTNLFLDFFACDAVELLVKEGNKFCVCRSTASPQASFRYEHIASEMNQEGSSVPILKGGSLLERLRRDLVSGKSPAAENRGKQGLIFSPAGSCLIRDLASFESPVDTKAAGGSERRDHNFYGTMALFPLAMADISVGLLQLMYKKVGGFNEPEMEHGERAARTLGIALVNQRAQAALQERVKELTCLYSISQVVDRQGISLEGILQGIAELLPPAWQYPEIAAGRIELDGKSYTTAGFQFDGQKQGAEIVVNRIPRGLVEVVYTEPKPELDEGPFLREERSLIDAIAGQVAIIVERMEAAQDRARLQEQLRHADRLATIGQLAAGVAHELNEPLGGVLGFAQLARKHPGIPQAVENDLAKIEAAGLHAREVVKKLMLFARQTPPKKSSLNLNKMIEEGLYFIKSRCAKSGIEIVLKLESGLPDIIADHSQIYQVLVNLVVNAVQAMPQGGKLTISTSVLHDVVSLIVEDTGVGMTPEVRKKIFLPFFTTKEINEGTGIGLAVVHGIVSSHGGEILVESQPGRGSRFEIQLPVNSHNESKEE